MSSENSRNLKTTLLHGLALLAVASLTMVLPGWKRTGLADGPTAMTGPAPARPSEREPASTVSHPGAEHTAPGTLVPDYDLIDLGTLGGVSSCAYSLNSAGEVVGSAATAAGEKHAFLYRDGIMRDLGTLGGRASTAHAISDTGEVVGQIQGLRRTDRPFRYHEGEMHAVDDFRGRFSSAWAVSNSGRVGGEFYDSVARRHRAFCLFPAEAVQRLGTLGGSDSRAFGINDAGQIVGVAATRYDWSQHAFLWQDGVMTDLGTLGGNDSEARAINNLGQVVGAAHTPSGEEHAFLYSGGTITDLGTLGGTTSRAQGINDAGTVVGWTAGMNPRAFLWRDGKMLDLNSLVAPNSGWLLTNAYDINDNEQIVGCGIRGGKPHAFLLSPKNTPTPITQPLARTTRPPPHQHRVAVR